LQDKAQAFEKGTAYQSDAAAFLYGDTRKL